LFRSYKKYRTLCGLELMLLSFSEMWSPRTFSHGTKIPPCYIFEFYQTSSSIIFTHYFFSYLLNPYIFLPTLALSTSTFENTLTLLSIMFASQGVSTNL
jgi:hypothetical protein